jgi:hypothetical protein
MRNCIRAQGEIQEHLEHAQEALRKCLAAEAATQLLEAQGYVTFLLVVEQGSGYGGGSGNWIDADVIFQR